MRKDFKRDNPALAFIHAPAEKEKETQPAQGTHHTQHTHYTDNRETRSKRINMLLTPSLHGNLTKIARVEGHSLNDLVNTVLKAYEQQEQESIEAYEKIWGEE